MAEMIDAIASLVFPHLGFRGWLEHYSADSPVWRLAYHSLHWAKGLEDETGWGLQPLFVLPDSTTIPYFSHDYIKDVMSRVVKRVIAEQNWQPVLDIVKKFPCEEDFEKWDTNVRIDFLRSWYHYRSTNVQTVSLETCLEDEEHSIYDIEDESANIEDTIAAEDFYQRFKDRLSQKDMEILQLRVEGYTYEEIGKMLGYKNHSGVIKRMQSITKAFIKYEEEQK
jgi:RNA polymerase sigma factor (sigma-70 family)